MVLGVVESADAFYSHETGIDWDVIFLLLGMMIIVGVLRQTGVFEYIAIWSVKRANGSPLRIMILLVLITAFASALLDNVTTVLLIAPVTLLVCDRLSINPVPFLIAEVFASNIGGTATLVGDPPNIIIASRAGLTFNDFLLHMTPIVLVVVAVFIALLPCLFRGSFDVDPERVADIMSLKEREAIRDPGLLVKCGDRSRLGVRGLPRASGVAHRAVDRGAGGCRHPDFDLPNGPIRLSRQCRVGDAALLRRSVRDGRRLGEDGCRREFAQSAIEITGGDALSTSC